MSFNAVSHRQTQRLALKSPILNGRFGVPV
jgi:hypothetical protein